MVVLVGGRFGGYRYCDRNGDVDKLLLAEVAGFYNRGCRLCDGLTIRGRRGAAVGRGERWRGCCGLYGCEEK